GVRSSRPALGTITAAVLIAAGVGVRAAVAFVASFDPDEFEHLHGAWCLAQGQWPYRDYFEHHTPWLHLALAPLLSLFRPESDPERALAVIFVARGLMWACATLAVALTFVLARYWAGAPAAGAAAALLGLGLTFVDKSKEIRPDVPAMACLIASWALTVSAWRRPGAGAAGRLGAAGLLLGAATLFTQKALFTAPASGLLLLWWLWDGWRDGTRGRRLGSVLLYGAGAVAPLLATLALFAPRTGVAAFVESNLWLNLRWPRSVFPAGDMVRRLVRVNWPLLALAAAGLVRAGRGLLSAARFERGDALLVLQAAGLAAGATRIPTLQAQYFLMLLPLAAVLAGGALAAAAGFLARRLSSAEREPERRGLLLAAGLLAACLPAAGTLALGVRPADQKMAEQLARLRFVLANTTPEQTVLDGFTGAGVFRPHAYYYFFLHDEVRPLLGLEELRRLRGQLRDGEIAPALVILDRDLKELDGEVVQFLADNYEDVGDGLMRRPRALWLDAPERGGRLELGEGPLEVLVGRGFTPSQREGARAFRRTQGRRATLRLPLRAPGAFRLRVHARGEPPLAGGRLALAVNEAPCGEQPLDEGWRDYVFEVPAGSWRAGVNRVRLVLGGGSAGDAGPPPSVAVDYVQLTP
ncbi:MAG TPA: hypothetical protein VF310_01515, partial [Vicinamibacteria bacterium]